MSMTVHGAMNYNRLLGEIADLQRQAEHSMGLSMDEFDLTLEVLVEITSNSRSAWGWS